MNERAGKGKPRRSISTAKQSNGQKVRSIIQRDISGNYIDKDIRYERTGQMRGRKYLRESCYHNIEYSAINSLAALMRK